MKTNAINIVLFSDAGNTLQVRRAIDGNVWATIVYRNGGQTEAAAKTVDEAIEQLNAKILKFSGIL